MTDNLIICCTLADTESEKGFRHAVGVLGKAIQVMPSVLYVASSYAAGEAADLIRSVTDPTTPLVVVNASTDDLAWFSLANGDRVQQLWDKITGQLGSADRST